MTDVTDHITDATWPLPVLLTRCEAQGAQAQGCVVAQSELKRVAGHMVSRAQRYAALRLTLTRSEAVFWSTRPVDLPWLPVSVRYLHTPTHQVFLPIGWDHNISEEALSALLRAVLSKPRSGNPVVLLPREPNASSSTIKLIELAESLSVAAVDWAFLSRGQHDP